MSSLEETLRNAKGKEIEKIEEVREILGKLEYRFKDDEVAFFYAKDYGEEERLPWQEYEVVEASEEVIRIETETGGLAKLNMVDGCFYVESGEGWEEYFCKAEP